jgi:putative transposase
MDAKGRCMDNIFVERLWRSLKYDEVYLNAYGLGYRTPPQIYDKGCGYVDVRLCRPAPLPAPAEPAQKAGNARLRLHTHRRHSEQRI